MCRVIERRGRVCRRLTLPFFNARGPTIAEAAARADVAVVLGTERISNEGVLATALVINRDGTVAGFQDKVQLDPSEDTIYAPGSGRQIFESGPLKFGVVICHEGWRYPETVRWAARRGAHIVFHPQFHEAGLGVMFLRVTQTRKIHFTRKQSCVVRLRILVTLQP